MRTALRQPVNRLTPKRWLTKRRLTLSRLDPPYESRTVLLFISRCAHGERILAWVTYCVRQRTFGALKAAKTHACRNYCRSEADLLQYAVVGGTALGTLGL